MIYVPDHMGTMLVMCDPQSYQAVGARNTRFMYGVEKKASKP